MLLRVCINKPANKIDRVTRIAPIFLRAWFDDGCSDARAQRGGGPGAHCQLQFTCSKIQSNMNERRSATGHNSTKQNETKRKQNTQEFAAFIVRHFFASSSSSSKVCRHRLAFRSAGNSFLKNRPLYPAGRTKNNTNKEIKKYIYIFKNIYLSICVPLASAGQDSI